MSALDKPGEVYEEDMGGQEQTLDSFDEHQLKRLKKINRKVDIRLLPALGAIYAISGIDRTNLANAQVAGMGKDLDMLKGSRYSIAVCVFFITYFICEIPSNIILRKVGAALWLSFLAFAWGICVLGAGFTHHWGEMVLIRLLLGIFEAGFIPGCAYLISCWYERYQMQTRISIFFSLSLLATAFGNILAYGLIHMDGVGGLAGWRWIYIIEGLMTIVLAVYGYIFIIDFPDKIHLARRPYLTPDEVALVQARLQADRGDAEFDPITWKKTIKTLAKWQLWIYALFFLTSGVGVYAFAYFLQIIVKGMGYSVSNTFLLCAPPNIAAIFYIIAVSKLADKLHQRGAIVAFQATTAFVGLMLIEYCKNNGVRYFGTFLGIAGCAGNVPASLAYQANNIRGQSTRAIGSGLQVCFGAIGGVITANVFLQREAPKYPTGIWVSAGCQILTVLLVCVLTVFHVYANRQAAKGRRVNEGLEGFRYTY
ncbi:MFS general substrate transporter [Mytilinidion resinicola]|uniref:MFS general substrate transporter n=1 Tax=Mytilinidion resinicola TaxID=574789 RepID=A0A6A6Z8U8_9PEZI|nr:MFS general substrate transporter [Mytilinidion resinicola]KAF2817436.1 MFS general substrate transporter [Mytilinidion resinicola]